MVNNGGIHGFQGEDNAVLVVIREDGTTVGDNVVVGGRDVVGGNLFGSFRDAVLELDLAARGRDETIGRRQDFTKALLPRGVLLEDVMRRKGQTKKRRCVRMHGWKKGVVIGKKTS